MEVLRFIHSMLGGSSPQTGYIGSAGIIMTVLDLMSQGSRHAQAEMAASGTPNTKMEWIILIVSVGLRLAKDANKTNSQHPSAEAVTVPAVSASPVTVQRITMPAPTAGDH
jgi:hypothetical protein